MSSKQAFGLMALAGGCVAVGLMILVLGRASPPVAVASAGTPTATSAETPTPPATPSATRATGARIIVANLVAASDPDSGEACELSPGDVTRLIQRPAADDEPTMVQVVTSHTGDCRAGTVVAAKFNAAENTAPSSPENATGNNVAAATAPVPRTAPPLSAKNGPQLLGAARGWNAYRTGSAGNAACYLVGRPVAAALANAGSGRLALSVTHRQAEHTFNVVNFNVGSAPDGAPASVDVDGRSFSLFVTKGGAWAPDAPTDKALTEALAKGQAAVVQIRSATGGGAVRYQLAGFATALKLIDRACDVQR